MSSTRPNIILILTDQQRGDCLGIEGHPVLQTPNLDWLARSGTHFRRGYSECPTCIPARRVIMSGQAPDVNGMVGYSSFTEWNPRTLASELSRAGYQTEMVGKLHLYPCRKRYGFDHLYLADSLQEKDNDYTDWLTQSGAAPLEMAVAHGVSTNGWVGRPNHLPEYQTHSFWCVSMAMDFIHRRDPTAPFFLNVSFYDPHPPLTPPQFYYDRYISRNLPMPVVGDWAPPFKGPEKGLDINAPVICLDPETMRCARAAYYGLINHIDDQVGRLLNFLRNRGLMEKTFILFTSDHGEMLGDHNMFRKGRAYEASARVPFFARAPKSMEFPCEVVSFAPVGLQDVMPTLLDVAGVPIPNEVTGHSLLPIMRNEQKQCREILHGEHADLTSYLTGTRIIEGMHYLTDGHFKYIWYSETGREQLFHLDEDPNELHDLSRESGAADKLKFWRKYLIDQLKDRPEGFSDRCQLIAGRPHKAFIPRPDTETKS